MHSSKRPDLLPDALRLVKTWLPVALIRQMDEAILASGGGYEGRDDFIREALADRVAEDRMRPLRGPAPVILLPTEGSKKPEASRGTSKPRNASREALFGPLPSEIVPTLPTHSIAGPLYGLHNRDYPTLWAALSLIEIVAAE